MSLPKNDFQHRLEQIQESIGYRFKNVSLLEQALTHRSFANENDHVDVDNERLEFLGDAVLELVVSERLFHRFDEMPEGDMSRARARIVRAESLAEVACDLELDDAIRLGRGELVTGGREKKSLLSDALEAVLGAMFLDSDYHTAVGVILGLLDSRFSSPETLVALDPKSRLQEIIQEQGRPTPNYVVIAQDGPDHDCEFTVGVVVDGEQMGMANGRSKKEAAVGAARAALQAMSADDSIPPDERVDE